MMKKPILFLLALCLFLLTACSPIKPAINNEFKLSDYATIKAAKSERKLSILVTHPDAAAGYRTEEMIYTIKPFTVNSFAHNAWVSPPGEMLLPLLVMSLQKTGFFYAVASSASSELTDYRIDTQLLELQQNFLHKPSTLDFSAKVVLTDVSANRILASRIIEVHSQCPTDSPYGGVVAANNAARIFTQEATRFVLAGIKGVANAQYSANTTQTVAKRIK